MNEVVIFCESYPQIKNALYLARQNYQSHPVTIVISGMSDLLKFFNLVNERVYQGKLNVVYFDIYLGRTARAGNKILKALGLLPDIIKERGYLRDIADKHFAHLRGAEVFFFSRCFNHTTFYLLRGLSKTNQLVYMPDPTYDAVSILQVTPTNMTELLYLLRSKVVYGFDISLGKHPLGQKTTRMPDKFLRERVTRVIPPEERDSMLGNLDISQLKLTSNSDYSIMYFHDNLAEYDYISDAAAFERRLKEVFDIIGKYFPANEVAVKHHPNDSGSETALPFGSRLPDFIPAEFFYNGKVKMYLGITSQALANVEKGLAVSLIDLVTFRDDTIKEKLKDALIQWSHTDILFPQTLDEFERILIDIKNHKLEEGK